MKKQLQVFSLLVAIALFSALVLTTCEKDEFTPPADTPLIDQNPALVLSGLYEVSDGCNEQSETYLLTINPDQEKPEEINLINFLNRNLLLRAYPEGDRFVIPLHYLPTPTETLMISGEVFSTPTEGVVIVYTLQSGHKINRCNATCTLSTGKD